MRKRQRQVNRYVRAVGSYLPCAGKHKKQLLTALRSEAEAYCAETRDADLEARFGTPQQVAAAYVDAMSTQELLAALRARLEVENTIVTGVHRGREIGYLARLGERTVSIQYPRVERTLHGTGDVFASALCGALLSGAEAPAALERAAEFCNACVEKTAQRQPAHWYGLAFEDVLKERNAL